MIFFCRSPCPGRQGRHSAGGKLRFGGRQLRLKPTSGLRSARQHARAIQHPQPFGHEPRWYAADEAASPLVGPSAESRDPGTIGYLTIFSSIVVPRTLGSTLLMLNYRTFLAPFLVVAAIIGLTVIPSVVHGAIDNEVGISGMDGVERFDAFSKSFVVEQTGYANMAVVRVDAGQVWEVRTARATNCSARPTTLSFKIVDQDGTTFMTMPEGASPVLVPAGGTLSWSGNIVVPAGWSVVAEWHELDASGCLNNAQVTSLVLAGAATDDTP